MKKIDLPITRSFTTSPINIREACEDLASGKKKSVQLGTIDFSVAGKELDQARVNGGLIIWSAICLEQKLESIITNYIFQTSKQTNEDKGRSFFSNRVIKADHFSYAVKKNLIIEIVNDESLLEGRDKDQLPAVLKKVMEFRNMFAHGDIIFENGIGCALRYWSGGIKKEVLTDEYLKNIEECFKSAHNLADQIISKITSV